jgi:hypothetical protein
MAFKIVSDFNSVDAGFNLNFNLRVFGFLLGDLGLLGDLALRVTLQSGGFISYSPERRQYLSLLPFT